MDAFAIDISEIDELGTQVAIMGSLRDGEPGDDLFAVVVAITYHAA
jgi:hypothetical protein